MASKKAQKLVTKIPHAYQGLPELLKKIGSADANEAWEATYETCSILIGESESYDANASEEAIQRIQDATLLAIVHSGAPRAIAEAAKRNHPKDLGFQQEALSLLCLISDKYPDSILGQGMVEHSLAAMREFSYSDGISFHALGVIENIIKTRPHTIEHYNKLGVLSATTEAMRKNFHPIDNDFDESMVLYTGASLLKMLAEFPGATSSMFDNDKTVSLVASIMEQQKMRANRKCYQEILFTIAALE